MLSSAIGIKCPILLPPGVAFRSNPWQEVIAGLGQPPLFLKVLLGTLFGCLADAVEPLRPVGGEPPREGDEGEGVGGRQQVSGRRHRSR